MKKWAHLPLALFLTAGCFQVSYPQDRMVQSLIELYRREYKMEISAKLLGNTLAARTSVHKLFESPVTLTPETDPQVLSTQLKFSSEGLDHLQHIALAVRRVVMSTDPGAVDFYHVVIEDADGGQLEFHWVGSVLDLKRLNTMDISQGDFLKYRSLIYFRHKPARLCAELVERLFDDLRHRAPIPNVARHFSPQADLRSLLPFLIQNLVPVDSRTGGGASLADVKTVQIAEDACLAFARMLAPVQGADGPTVREQGYYFLLDVGELSALIRRIVPVSARSADLSGQGRWEIPAEFASYGSPEQWSDQDWYVEPISMSRFLAHQIARRVRYDIGSRPEMSGFGIAGEFLENEFHFQFRLAQPAVAEKPHPKKPAVIDPKTPEGLAGLIAQTAAQVVYSYQFKQFKGLSIVDAESGKSWKLVAEQLPVYRRKAVPLVPIGS